jgi:signal peptidase I
MSAAARPGRHLPRHRSPARPAGRWIDRGLTALLVAMLLALAATVAGAATGVRLLLITSGSMTPTLPVGDLVVSRPVSPAQLRSGDIVTFHHPGLRVLVTHRVVETRRTGGWVQVTTRGDANTAAEVWRAQADGRVGRAVFHVPIVAWLLELVRAPSSWTVMMVIGGLYAGAGALRRSRTSNPAHRGPRAIQRREP